jgi:hypothetical protein
VKSFSPAGMTQKGFWGRGARTFGNPGGATSGGGGTSAVLTWQSIFSGFQVGSIPETVWVLSETSAVVGCQTTGEILYTTDGGSTWADGTQTVPARRDVFEFASDGNGTLVAYGTDNTNRAQLSRSADGGATWTVVSPALAAFQQIALGTDFLCIQWSAAINRFVCFASDGAGTTVSCFTSPDGITWHGAALDTASFFLGDFRATNGVIIVVGSTVSPLPDSTIVQRSADGGLTWATVLDDNILFAGFRPLTTVEFNGVSWNATGANATDNINYTSPNGITWTLQNTVSIAGGEPPYSTTQAAVAGRFVSFSNAFASTADIGVSASGGVAWSQLTIPNSVFFVLNVAGQLYGFGDGISSSSDGINWVSQLAAGGLSVNCVRASGPPASSTLSLAVGEDGGGNPTIWKLQPPVAAPSSLTFQLTPGGGPSSNGPYNAPFSSTWGFGCYATGQPHGSILGTITPAPPALINGAEMVAFGSIEGGPGGPPPDWITVCVFGTVAQNFFTTLAYTDTNSDAVVLNTSTADFNTTFNEPGFTIWAWRRGTPGVPDFPVANNSDIVIAW